MPTYGVKRFRLDIIFTINEAHDLSENIKMYMGQVTTAAVLLPGFAIHW